MSSLIRRIQRTVKNNEEGALVSRRAHFGGRGTMLGTRNPKDTCINRAAKKRPKPWRAAHKVDRAALKPGLPRSWPQPLAPKPTKADQRADHARRMERKARRRDKDRLAIAWRSEDSAILARAQRALHKGKR